MLPPNQSSRFQRNLPMVLDSLRCTTLWSDDEQLTACNNLHQKLAAASFKSNFVVKHWRPLRGWEGTPFGGSFLWEAPTSIYSMLVKCNLTMAPDLVSSSWMADVHLS